MEKDFDCKLSTILKNKQYVALIIKRLDRDCYLLINIEDQWHVLTNQNGKHKIYRHAWQIREMLKSKFNIEEEIPVERIKE